MQQFVSLVGFQLGELPVQSSGSAGETTIVAVLHGQIQIGSFTENLLAYGVGRVLDYRDMPTVRSVQRAAAEQDNRFSSFVLGVVKSAPFQMRTFHSASDEALDQ